MRPRVLNRIPLSFSTAYRRSFLQIPAQAKEPTIFENSLEKTLQVHRTANRESLIRRVAPRPNSQSPNQPAESSSSESPESQAQPSTTQPSTSQDVSARKKNTKKSNKRQLKERSTSADVSASSSIKWRVKTGTLKQCPWLDSLGQDRRFVDNALQLHEEVCALTQYLAPSDQERKVVDQLATDAINLIFKNASHFKMFNIKRTGFTTSDSGLDLIFSSSSNLSLRDMKKAGISHTGKLRQYDEFLHLAQQNLEQHSSYTTVRDERQKILVVLHKPTGAMLRISCAQDESAYLEYLRDFHAEYRFLRPLYETIRLILETRGLFGSAKSCIDSNDLQVLIAAFLKINHGRYRRRADCAEPLLGFLRTFGSEINLSLIGISTDPPGYFNTETVDEAYAQHDPEDIPAYLRGQRTLIKRKRTAARMGNRPVAQGLLIQSPGNYMKQLSSSCFRTRKLQATFADAHERLRRALDAWRPSGQITPSTSILGSVLRTSFDDFEARRTSILAGKPAVHK